MRSMVTVAFLASMLSGAFLSGCGEAKPFELSYERPAKYEIPAKVRKIAIAEFVPQGGTDRQYSAIAADRLASSLDAANKKYDRYVLYDRKRLGEIMKERDLQIAISDSASAATVGKIAAVDAIIYGTVTTVAEEKTEMRTIIDPLSRSTRERPYRKLVCMAAVTFTMDDVGSSKTLATLSVSKDYDSEKASEGSGLGKAFGLSGDKIPASATVLGGLIEGCVQEFLAAISPHVEVVQVELATGSSYVKDGNKFALAKEYEEALICYRRAIKENPKDHGALFNAGLMLEAQRKLAEAEEMYDKAIDVKPEPKYIESRKRVKEEQRNSPVKPAEKTT